MEKSKLISAREALAVLLANSLIVGTVALAQTSSATVAATVTAQKVSVTVSDGSVSYGTVPLSQSKDTTGAVNDTQLITNDGNVAEDFNVRGTDSTNWALGAAVGSDVYMHEFCTTGTGSPDLCDAGAVWNKLTSGSETTLANNVAAAGNQKFDLKLTMPSATSNYGQQSFSVIVQAVAH